VGCLQRVVVHLRHLRQILVLEGGNILHVLLDSEHFDSGGRLGPQHLAHEVLAHDLDVLVALVRTVALQGLRVLQLVHVQVQDLLLLNM